MPTIEESGHSKNGEAVEHSTIFHKMQIIHHQTTIYEPPAYPVNQQHLQQQPPFILNADAAWRIHRQQLYKRPAKGWHLRQRLAVLEAALDRTPANRPADRLVDQHPLEIRPASAATPVANHHPEPELFGALF